MAANHVDLTGGQTLAEQYQKYLSQQLSATHHINLQQPPPEHITTVLEAMPPTAAMYTAVSERR